MTPETVNHTRYAPDSGRGHYESFFLRANHPTRPLAFWIRYTIFAPRQAAERAVGELWAIYFDGEARRHAVAKREVPLRECRFDPQSFAVEIAGARLGPGSLQGIAQGSEHRLSWDLSFSGNAAPLFFLPQRLYEAKLPKAKSLVSLPLALFRGWLDVDGSRVDIDGWVGSQNHNWGSQHTDEYAWGQVAGFDDHPTSFLEVASARLRIGPVRTPWMTPLVLRHGGEEIRLSSIWRAIRAKRTLEYFTWRFESTDGDVAVEGVIEAPRDSFVGLAYNNPPGGVKQCLNSKLASCTVRLRRHRNSPVETLSTAHRAAFEILTDDRGHGVPILA